MSLVVSLCNPRGISDISFSSPNNNNNIRVTLEYDFYRESCPQAESIVRSEMGLLFTRHPDISPSLLRLFFHDCFIQGCDASILLDPSPSHPSEKQAIPNLTLKGFHFIDRIKRLLESLCPRVVSCADILSLATRDAILLAGGPFYPVFTGRRDSTRPYYQQAMAQMPTPNDHIDRTLYLFASRGFDETALVSLLGAHSIGTIACQFVLNRLYNFSGTSQPDPSIDPDFLTLMRTKCQQNHTANPMSPASSPVSAAPANDASRRRSTLANISYFQQLSPSLSSQGGFDAHYYKSLLGGRGLLYADQQLMANHKTARLVKAYASDDGFAFRMDFARSMVKLSALNVLTGSQGQIRETCTATSYFV